MTEVSLSVRSPRVGTHNMRTCVSYVSLPSIGVDVPAHSQSPLMRETTVLCEVVCEAEPAKTPNGADFALRRDDELCAHDGESRIGVFDASESDGRTRHARRGRLHSRYRWSSGGLPVSRQVSTKYSINYS